MIPLKIEVVINIANKTIVQMPGELEYDIELIYDKRDD